MPQCSFRAHISFTYSVKPDSLRMTLAKQTIQTTYASRSTVIHILPIYWGEKSVFGNGSSIQTSTKHYTKSL